MRFIEPHHSFCVSNLFNFIFTAENGYKILVENFSVDLRYILNLYKGKIVDGRPSIPLWIVDLPLSPGCLDAIVHQYVNNASLFSMVYFSSMYAYFY